MIFDIAILGSGPGGYVCAVRAAQLGLQVAIIEMEKKLGGTCLNRGCIPTKALLQTAHTKRIIEKSAEFGIESHIESINFEKVINRSCEIVSGLNSNLDKLMERNKITIFNGIGKFLDKKTLIINDKDKVTARNIVIATGAIPRILPIIPKKLIEKGLIWTSTEAMLAQKCPKKLLVIGSGAIGVEFASFYNTMGSDVSVIEIQDRILVNEDTEISKTAQRAFEKKGIKFKLKTTIGEFLETDDGKLSVEMSDGSIELFDKCVVATGVVPNTKDLGLEKIGIKVSENGNIITDKFMQTSVPNIYAIGDVVSTPWLAHKASREGMICAEKIAKKTDIQTIVYSKIPSCTYSDPEIASIGMTEHQAQENNIKVKIGRSYFKGNGRALVLGETGGFVKVIFDSKTGECLGAHMIGPDVTELISVFSVIVSAELTEKEIISTIFPHPTISECLHEAVMDAYGIGIH